VPGVRLNRAAPARFEQEKAAMAKQQPAGVTLDDSNVAGIPTVGGGHFGTTLPQDVSYNVGAGTITETLIGSDATTVVVFVPDAGSTTHYHAADVSTTFTNLDKIKGGFSFGMEGGLIASVQRIDVYGGQAEVVKIDLPLDVAFKSSGDIVVEQYIKGSELDTIVFTRKAGSDLYVRESAEKTFIDPGSASTVLDVHPMDRMVFTFDAEGDVAKAKHMSAEGDLQKVTDAHITFTRLSENPSFVEMVTTRGTQSSYVVYYEGQSGAGVYTEVAHGSGSTVDLAGLQSQVHAAEQLTFSGAKSPNSGWII
jgi:hypothetical protein